MNSHFVGSNDSEVNIKKRLGSLMYIRKLCVSQIRRVKAGELGQQPFLVCPLALPICCFDSNTFLQVLVTVAKLNKQILVGFLLYYCIADKSVCVDFEEYFTKLLSCVTIKPTQLTAFLGPLMKGPLLSCRNFECRNFGLLKIWCYATSVKIQYL